jgi:hypothetical protein
VLIGGRRITVMIKVGGTRNRNRSRKKRRIGYAAFAWREIKAQLLFHVDTPFVGFVQEKCGLIEGAVLSATVPFSTSLISSSNQQRQRRFFQCLVFGFKPRFDLHHLLHLFKEVFSALSSIHDSG